MFRLDFMRADNDLLPVRGADLGILPTGDVLTRHMTTARSRAIQAASLHDCPVLITRIGKSGTLKPSLIIAPDGSAKRPPNMSGVECRREQNLPGACFCPNCRAQRR